MGVIGTGGIGRETIRIAKGFAMEVMAFKTRRKSGSATQFPIREQRRAVRKIGRYQLTCSGPRENTASDLTK